jgi:gamma-glutamyl hercynylcysteine S-oxide synthase
MFSVLRRSAAAPPRAAAGAPESVGDSAADHLLAQGRYAVLLDRDREQPRDERTIALAWLALEQNMAFVPAPDLANHPHHDGQQGDSSVPAIYLDRCATTNAQFANFVADDGYSQMDLWPQSIWPNLLQFVDESGHSGPRFWKQGQPPRGREDHPVVGINWFEARAYALWCGKRLPTSDEWEHAASCCGGPDGRTLDARYPWGDVFSPDRCNTWTGGPGETVPVTSYDSGATPNGIYQLIGNVWEWVATQFEYIPQDRNLRIAFEEPMVEIRGGAFDTYLETQATCQFRTGQPFLYRGGNVGFRCCLPASRLVDPPAPTAFA